MDISAKSRFIQLAKKQLSLDLNCFPEQFDAQSNSITEAALINGRRRFMAEKDFFRMATFGKGTVITADKSLTKWCGEFFCRHEGIRLFEHYVMIEIEKKIRKYKKTLFGVSEYYLPRPGFDRKPVLFHGAEVRWFEKAEIPELYSDKRFKNALLYDVNGLRPDILAVAAYIDGRIEAVAGASMDSELFWQVGIDVMPEHRNKGLGVYLVSALTEEILKRDAMPYYGTWSANIASRSVAASSGYFPAWVETFAISKS